MYSYTPIFKILQNTYWAGDQDGLIADLYIRTYKFIEISLSTGVLIVGIDTKNMASHFFTPPEHAS